MDNDLIARFSLPSHGDLLREARGRTEVGSFQVFCGAVLEGRSGPIGLNLGVDGRQRRYWLPIDHPRFADAHAAIYRASKTDERIGLVLDPVNYIVLDVAGLA